MNTPLEWMFFLFGLVVVSSPTILVALLGLSGLLGIPLTEESISRLTRAAVVLGLLPAIAIVAMMLGTGARVVPIDLGDWVAIEEEKFHFHLKFVFDRLSVPFVILAYVLCGVIGEFTRRYLHREDGYRRFFLFYSLFFAGMIISAAAGTIETLFLGWELVGLSSALLVAYFHEHRNPVTNGARVWGVYRIADACFLIAALTLHHLTGEGDFRGLMGAGAWPEGTAEIQSHHALVVGTLLLIAAAGKSALIPFSGWLPRAMEGPTPSSAVFYGALSVHLGAYLLLRVSPILDASAILQWLVILVGVTTAVSATLIARVQSDVKSLLAFASLTQVGIIIVEIGLGLRYLALIHIVGHACLRTLQLVRAPSLLLDYSQLENAIGDRLAAPRGLAVSRLPSSLQWWLYRFGFERGFLDTLLDRWIKEPFLAAIHWADSWERRWTDWLSREPSRESDAIEAHPEVVEGTR